MRKVYECTAKRIVPWGGSISLHVEQAGKELQETVFDIANRACERRLGEYYYVSLVEFVMLEHARVIRVKETGEEIVRFSPIMHNGFKDMQNRQRVILSTQYTTFDGEK